jgi:hypothetical protein
LTELAVASVAGGARCAIVRDGTRGVALSHWVTGIVGAGINFYGCSHHKKGINRPIPSFRMEST